MNYLIINIIIINIIIVINFLWFTNLEVNLLVFLYYLLQFFIKIIKPFLNIAIRLLLLISIIICINIIIIINVIIINIIVIIIIDCNLCFSCQ